VEALLQIWVCWGRRFGFVKFKEVEDEEELGKRLDDVWFGDSKLKVNRARFGREEKAELETAKASNLGKLESKVVLGASYSDVISKSKGIVQ